jgi:hypothetical protein
MAQAAHIFPNFTQQMGLGSSSSTPINLSTDTLKVGLVASGTFNWVASTQAYTTVAQFLTNAGSGGGGALTEVSTSGTGYTRQALTSVTYTETGLVSTLTCANPSWTNATFSSVYAFFYDYTAGGSSDTNGIVLCYWDFGGTQTVTSATFTLTISGSGLATWTSS